MVVRRPVIVTHPQNNEGIRIVIKPPRYKLSLSHNPKDERLDLIYLKDCETNLTHVFTISDLLALAKLRGDFDK